MGVMLIILSIIYSYRGSIGTGALEVNSIHGLEAFQEHWYRNPRIPFLSLTNPFRYNPT